VRGGSDRRREYNEAGSREHRAEVTRVSPTHRRLGRPAISRITTRRANRLRPFYFFASLTDRDTVAGLNHPGVSLVCAVAIAVPAVNVPLDGTSVTLHGWAVVVHGAAVFRDACTGVGLPFLV